MNDYAQYTKIPSFFDKFDPMSVGFDKTFKLLADQLETVGKNVPGYPPYNIKKVDENKYVIELAVAGFAKTDLEVTLDGGKLTIAGKTKDASDLDNANAYYFYKGIAERAFTRTFTLADSVEIKNAEMVNGILKVWLENFIPEHKKPKKFDIKDGQ
jgi:molecular chaperone IbpA